MVVPTPKVWATNDPLDTTNLNGGISDPLTYALNPPAALATRTTLSIANATIVPVTFDVEVFDNGSFFAPTSAIFTVPDRGFYVITGTGTWGTLSATGYRTLLIYQLGIEIAGQYDPGDASASIRQSLTVHTLCSAGDTIELRAFHTLGVAQNLVGARLGLHRASGT